MYTDIFYSIFFQKEQVTALQNCYHSHSLKNIESCRK